MDLSNLTDNPDNAKNVTVKPKDDCCNHADFSPTPQNKKNCLEFDLNSFKSKLFANTSDDLSLIEKDQGRIFNEIEVSLLEEKNRPKNQKNETPCFIANENPKTKDQTISFRLIDQLPIRKIIHDIPASRKKCNCGEKLKSFGSETIDKIEILPPQINLIRHICLKYVCTKCKDSQIRIATAFPQFLPKELADVSMLAFLFVSKFCKGIPFSKLGTLFSNFGFKFNTTSFCHYAFNSYERLKYLEDDFWKELFASVSIQIIETPIIASKEKNETKTQANLYVLRGLNRGKSILRFHYIHSHNKQFLNEKLKYYKGIIQTKDIVTFKSLTSPESKISNACCWGNFRRMFSEIIATDDKHEGAIKLLNFISEIYEIEDKIKPLSREERKLYRQTVSRRVIDRIFEFIDKELKVIPTNQLYANAIQSLNSQSNQLLVFMDHPEIPLDTDLAENDIQPFVNPNENWLFSDISETAEMSTFFYSLLETAKANGYDPFLYLKSLCLKIQSGESPKLFQVD